MAYGINSPRGLQPSVTLTGSTWNGQLNEYQIQSNNGTAPGYAQALFTGDPITYLNDGTIGIAAPGAAVTGVFFGCKYTVPSGQSGYNGPYVFSPYWPGGITVQPNTNITALIVDDPNVLFDIQSSNSNPTSAAAATLPLGVMASNVGNNANFAIGGIPFTDAIVPQNPTSGNTINGQSSYYLDVNTIGTTSNLNLKIVRLSPIVTPSITNQGPAYNVFYPAAGTGVQPGNFNNVLVALNDDVYKGGYGTASGITNVTTINQPPISLNAFLLANTTAIQLVPAVANAVIIVNSFAFTITYGGTAFGNGGVVSLQYGNDNFASTTFPPAAITGIAANTTLNFQGTPVYLNANINTGVFLDVGTANFSGGNNSTISYTLNYSVVPF